MFDGEIENLEPDRIIRYRATRAGKRLTFGEVVDLWQDDAAFRSFFAALLADSPFSAFRWECPPVTRDCSDSLFEFVLVNTPSFEARPTDPIPFRDHFSRDEFGSGVEVFGNVSGDAILVVPSPRGDDAAYGHLAAFLRHGPASQVDALLRAVGQVVSERIGDRPLWLSTAGGGVAWLHVRLDDRPKYYVYGPYRERYPAVPE